MEVAAVDSSSRLVVRRQGINPHVAGTEGLCTRSHGKVAHVPLYLMIHFQVAVNVEMCATADGQEAVGDAQSVQVGTVEVHHHRTTQALLTHQHIHRGDALHEVVLAVHGGIGTPVPDFRIGLHATEVVATILELLNVGLRRERRAGRHQVGALSFQVDGASEWAQPVVRQEVLQRQAVGFQLCLIGFTTGIVAHRSAKGSSRLAGSEAGTIFLSVGRHSAFQGKVARNVHILAQVLRHQLFQETGIAGMSIHVHIGLQTVGIVEVLQRSRGFHAEGCGQRHIQVTKIHVLHVAAHHTINLQLLVRPFLAEARRHVLHEAHQVLLAQRGMHRSLQRAWMEVGECVERHVQVATNRRLGGFNATILQCHPSSCLHAVVVFAGMHGKLSRHVLHVETALLLKRKFLQIGGKLWLAGCRFIAIADVLGM